MKTEFKKGDIIRFADPIEKSGSLSIPDNFYTECDGIPDGLIIHGSTTLEHNIGTVIAIWKKKKNNFIIVNFENRGGKFTQLAFIENQLILIEEKTFKVSYVQSGETKIEEIKGLNKEAAFAKIKYDSINYVMES